MKKILFLFALLASTLISNGQSATPRFGTLKNQDDTYRAMTLYSPTIAYDDTLVMRTYNYFTTIYEPAQLTGTVLLSAVVTNCKAGDELICIFQADASSRTITFSTNLVVSASTLVVDSAQQATITFRFSKRSLKWVEVARAKE